MMNSSTMVKDPNPTELELTLGLRCDCSSEDQMLNFSRRSKRTLPESNGVSEKMGDLRESSAPAAKTQIVGWPPVQSFRRNSFREKQIESEANGMYVKVSMDGAPYLRKIDLNVYRGYPDFLNALSNMFKCFAIDLEPGRDGGNRSEYAVTYEDKDGDWMLVGDVPFDMFVSSCKRLRIMKGSDARGVCC